MGRPNHRPKKKTGASQELVCRRETKRVPSAAPLSSALGSAGRLRLVGGFFLRLLFWYGLVIAMITLWPAFQRGYAAFFRAYAGGVFDSFHLSGRTEWVPAAGHGDFDTEVKLRNVRVPGLVAKTYCGSRRMGYAPLSLIVALILATPLPWRRRWIAMLWGLLAVHLFIALRLEIMLLSNFCGDIPLRLYTPTPFWRGVLHEVSWVIAGAFPSAFIGPAVLWVLVTFRRGDSERWIGPRVPAGNYASAETARRGRV